MEVSVLLDDKADHIILWVLGNYLIIVVGIAYYLSKVCIPASIEIGYMSSLG